MGELFGALANNLAPLPLPMTKEQLEAKAENENRVYERLTRGGAARAARANCTNTTSALACSTFTLRHFRPGDSPPVNLLPNPRSFFLLPLVFAFLLLQPRSENQTFKLPRIR